MFNFFKKLFQPSAPASRHARPDEDEAPAEETPTPRFLHREPILNGAQRIDAYEFSLERPQTDTRRDWLPTSRHFFDEALLTQLTDNRLAALSGKRLAFVSLRPEALGSPLLRGLPAANTVISLLDSQHLDPDAADTAIAQATGLKSAGFRLASPNTFTDGPLAALLQVSDFITVSVAGLTPPDMLAITRAEQKTYPAAKLVARGVDSPELFDACKVMHFDYFLGRYLTQPRQQREPNLSSQRIVVTELIGQLKRHEPDFDKLAMIARQDLVLTIRLLRYINSAAMGLSHKVGSLEQAMTYIGHDGLYRWLTLLLFYNSTSSEVDEALRETALARARFCEQLARRRLSKTDCEQAFVAGMLSMADILFQMPMREALGHLGLPEEIQLALLEKKGKFGVFVGLAIASETGDTEAIANYADQIGLDPDQVNALHIESLGWAVEYGDQLESQARF